jgi:acetoin utilization deacetylase AcuC-like enzyme
VSDRSNPTPAAAFNACDDLPPITQFRRTGPILDSCCASTYLRAATALETTILELRLLSPTIPLFDVPERHSCMKIFYCDQFVLPLPEGHRFPMAKYSLLRQRVAESRLAEVHRLVVPEAADDDQLRLVHTREYVEKIRTGSLPEFEMRRIGFPWSPQLVERSRRSVGGTIAAARSALIGGTAVNLAGGTHHAFADRGEGFCVFNDAAVAARVIQAEDPARRLLIIDCDVHQGNGTAAIFFGDATVFTFSLHGADNFPFRKTESDIDIALPNGTTGAAYLEALEAGLTDALERAGADLAIYLAGADPYVNDRYGKLALTFVDLAARDRLVFERCRATGLPVATVMSGGYAKRITDIVEIHFQTVSIAADFADPPA